jgi:hypothetical protein
MINIVNIYFNKLVKLLKYFLIKFNYFKLNNMIILKKIWKLHLINNGKIK